MLLRDNPHRQFYGEPHWYALHTKSRHEKKVDIRLKQKGIVSYLPLTTIYRRWSDRHKKVEEPLFSCYVFVHITLADRLAAIQTAGAVSLVCCNGSPSPIPELQINAIKQILDENCCVEHFDPLVPGQPVRIIRGPLRGFEGKFVKLKNSSRFVISVESIRQAIAVEIEPGDLEVIGQSHA